MALRLEDKKALVAEVNEVASKAFSAVVAEYRGLTAGEMDEQALMDGIAECGNLCCGIFNRELGRFFPHLGMSTPNVIDTQCVAYLQKLNCAHVRHFAIDMPDAPRLHVSLAVSTYDRLDFAVAPGEEADTTGELELF